MPWPLQIIFWFQLVGVAYTVVDLVMSRPDLAEILANLLVSALAVFLVLRLRAGRRWVRSVFALLSSLTVLFALAHLATGDMPPLVLTVSSAVTLVLLYLPNSNAFFAARSGEVSAVQGQP